jgi:hypothetical protein
MKITFADKSIAWLTLLSGLSISAVAVWYSVAGLISIFAAAAVPIAIMGIVLELSKLVATVWLKQNWFIAPRLIKAYLLIAVTILMVITSMGIFGYLSKAHLDQAVPTGDVAAKVALIDEKIKTERDNIDAARRALQQMDAQVDQMLGRSDTERGAERAVQIRKNQAKERSILQSDIAKSQKAIAALNQERAPIASELRKVEAEVGPIKYIAALLYGDNPDQNVLERAVRWVIILIVVIFDPLAVVLLLASQYSFQYFRRVKEEENAIADTTTTYSDVHVPGLDVPDEPVVEQQPVSTEDENLGPCPNCGKQLLNAKGIDIFCPNAECEYNKSGDPEIDEFFSRVREISRKLDEEERAAEANEKILQYEKDDGPLTDDQIDQLRELAKTDLPKGEVVKTDTLFEQTEMASDLVEIDYLQQAKDRVQEKIAEAQEEQNQEPYPFPTSRPLEGDAKLEAEKSQNEKSIDVDEEEDTDAKRKWKLLNPEDTIKRQRSLYEKGLIDQLPWETIEKFDSEKIEYVQNSEQGQESIWNRIKKD